MSTGWKWVRDDGVEYKSQRDAMLSLRERPQSRIEFEELSMEGKRRTDVTDVLRAQVRAAPFVCLACGADIAGDHLADAPCPACESSEIAEKDGDD